VLFLGREGSLLSRACLELLLASNIRVVAIGIDRVRSKELRRNARDAAKRAYGVAANCLRRLGVPLRHHRSLGELADARRIDRLDGRDINAPRAVGRIRSLKPDVIAIAGFSRILNAEVINVPTRACINTHPALLPKYRGPNPYRWVLRHREKTTGVTIHLVTPQIDAGDIILQREIPIAPDETQGSLIRKTLPVAAEMLVEAIELIAEGKAKPVPQDHDAASYFS